MVRLDKPVWFGSLDHGWLLRFLEHRVTDRRVLRLITRHWHKSLNKRSQRHNLPWTRMHRIAERRLPPVQRLHPFPNARFHAKTQGRSPVR